MQSRTFIGQLVVSGAAVARLAAEVSVAHPIALQAEHVLSGGADVLAITVTNAGEGSLAVGAASWQIGSQSGTVGVGSPLPGGSSRSAEVPLGGLASGTYAVPLRLPVSGYPDVTLTGEVVMVDHSSMTAVPKKTITVDGSLDDLSGVPGLDLGTQGTLHTAPSYQYGGPGDLSGSVWLTWDEEYLYLSARIQDNTQHQPFDGWQLWNGDSIQLGMSPGMPGERGEWYVATVALGAGGPELYSSHNFNPGVPVGGVSDARVGVSRDEANAQTVYELGIPWSELPPFRPGDGLLSVALVVNDNDGSGRNDWITWGGGINHAVSTAPNLFLPAFLSG